MVPAGASPSTMLPRATMTAIFSPVRLRGESSRAHSCCARRQQQHAPGFKAQLQMVKNTAYAWRQALYFLSLCDRSTQWQVTAGLEELVSRQPEAWAQRFEPIARGLQMTLTGGRFDADGRGQEDPDARRFLGWSVGPHWLLG